MKYIETLREGERVGDIYLCKFKQSAMTKNGKVRTMSLSIDHSPLSNASFATSVHPDILPHHWI